VKKKRKIWHRLPEEVVNVLRHKGGPQGMPKGKRGYRRSVEKNWQKYI